MNADRNGKAAGGVKVLVAGCGSIGRRHIANLRRLGITEILAVDPQTERVQAVRQDSAAVGCASLEQGLTERPDAVIVCTPPTQHVLVAMAAIKAGAHVFIEKPISDSLEGVEDLCHAARAAGRGLMVGYQLRFHPGLQAVRRLILEGRIGRVLSVLVELGQYLPDWRPSQDYRESYSAQRALGGGILLDASHEFDYLGWIFGRVKAVTCVAGHLSRLEMDVEDVAEVILEFAGGPVAAVHLDCVQRGYTRKAKFIGEHGTILWEFRDGVRVLGPEGTETDRLTFQSEVNDLYLDEMRHFLDCVAGRAQPDVTGEAAQQALAVVLTAREASQIGQRIVMQESGVLHR